MQSNSANHVFLKFKLIIVIIIIIINYVVQTESEILNQTNETKKLLPIIKEKKILW